MYRKICVLVQKVEYKCIKQNVLCISANNFTLIARTEDFPICLSGTVVSQ